MSLVVEDTPGCDEGGLEAKFSLEAVFILNYKADVVKQHRGPIRSEHGIKTKGYLTGSYFYSVTKCFTWLNINMLHLLLLLTGIDWY